MDSPEERPTLRQTNGRFAKGTKGGPGPTPTGRLRAWKEMLHKILREDDLEKAIDTLRKKSAKGSVMAATTLVELCQDAAAPDQLEVLFGKNDSADDDDDDLTPLPEHLEKRLRKGEDS
jgi:hypothetical protein